jgi:hypothetical protein
MQCSRCSYIQFKSSPKCGNCGYDFKKLKSDALAEVESAFTIFATAGAGVTADLSGSSTAIEEGFPQESSMADGEGLSTEMESAELFDSPSGEFQNEMDGDRFADFELDLSEADGPDSEGWNIGATLAEDLSETTSPDSEDFLEDADLETGDFEVQGLGFDIEATPTEPELSDDVEVAEVANEANPESNEFFLPNESEQNSADDSNEITLETELPVEHIEIEDIEQETEPEPSVELTVVPEAESTVNEVESTVPEAELAAPEIELNPAIEMDELDLETDSPKIEPVTEEQSQSPETALDGLELTMDSSEDEASDEEPTPES